jgi:hypothetical protein
MLVRRGAAPSPFLAALAVLVLVESGLAKQAQSQVDKNREISKSPKWTPAIQRFRPKQSLAVVGDFTSLLSNRQVGRIRLQDGVRCGK